jgi:hypothetical protein
MNYLLLAKTFRQPGYYEDKVREAINSNCCIVGDQFELTKILEAAEKLGVLLPLGTMTTDDFVNMKMKNNDTTQ